MGLKSNLIFLGRFAWRENSLSTQKTRNLLDSFWSASQNFKSKCAVYKPKLCSSMVKIGTLAFLACILRQISRLGCATSKCDVCKNFLRHKVLPYTLKG